MSSSTITPEAITTPSTSASEESTLFDLTESPRNDIPDSGVIPNQQAASLLNMLRSAEAAAPGSAPSVSDHDTISTACPVAPPAMAAQDLVFDDPVDLPPDSTRADEPAEQTDSSSSATMTGKPMPELPPKGSIAALAARRPSTVPKRIGSGRLVPARLTWKPRDPFAMPAPAKRSQFRWDTMLTWACVTAACGLGCIWLLRSILT